MCTFKLVTLPPISGAISPMLSLRVTTQFPSAQRTDESRGLNLTYFRRFGNFLLFTSCHLSFTTEASKNYMIMTLKYGYKKNLHLSI